MPSHQLARTAFVLLSFIAFSGCTKEGDLWNLNRRNPLDSGVNINPDDDRLPFVKSLLPTEEDPTQWRADLIHHGNREVVAVGWVWTTDGSDPEYPQLPAMASDRTGLGLHTQSAPSGLCESVVRYRAFAVNRFGAAHGEVLEYTVEAQPMEVAWTAPNVGLVTTTTIGINVVLSTGVCTPVESVGICWDYSPGASIEDNTSSVSASGQMLESTLSGLSPQSTVYLRFYAVINGSPFYSNEVVVQTQAPTTPSVTTELPTNVAETAATLNGVVLDDGGSAVSERGFYLAQHPNPSEGDVVISGGSGVGSFTGAALSLIANTTYHFRAYASNGMGIASGQVQNFTTPESLTPQPVSPAGGETIGCCYFTLDWTCSPGALQYEVQLSTNEDFSGEAVSMPEAPAGWLSVGTLMAAVYPAGCFAGEWSSGSLGTGSSGASGETFFWRVRVNNGGNPGPWSPAASFVYIY